MQSHLSLSDDRLCIEHLNYERRKQIMYTIFER